VIAQLQPEPDALDGWRKRLAAQRTRNIAAVALANKNARIVWALLAHERSFRPGYVPARAVAQSDARRAERGNGCRHTEGFRRLLRQAQDDGMIGEAETGLTLPMAVQFECAFLMRSLSADSIRDRGRASTKSGSVTAMFPFSPWPGECLTNRGVSIYVRMPRLGSRAGGIIRIS